MPPNAQRVLCCGLNRSRAALGDRMRSIILLLGLIVLAGPSSAEERIWRLGVLTPFDWPADATMHSVMIPELARRGFVEGRNLVVLPRWGGNVGSEQLARLAQDLATAKPDVIIAVSPRAITAAMTAAPKTPIVASFTTDPVAEGEAASMSKPGGEVTGIAMLASEGDKERKYPNGVPARLPLRLRVGPRSPRNRLLLPPRWPASATAVRPPRRVRQAGF